VSRCRLLRGIDLWNSGNFSRVAEHLLSYRTNTGRFSATSAALLLGCFFKGKTFQTEVSPAVHSRPTSQPEVCPKIFQRLLHKAEPLNSQCHEIPSQCASRRFAHNRLRTRRIIVFTRLLTSYRLIS
jgi:hypothetical protein